MEDETGWIKVEELREHPDNPRQHTEEQLEKIARSIKELGWGRPLIISADNYILAGHGAYLAAKVYLNQTTVPYKRMPHTHTSPEALAYMVADNKLTDESDWNYGKLEPLMQNVELQGFDVTLTGFEPSELQIPDFQPTNAEDQPRLDELKKVKCPECGYEF